MVNVVLSILLFVVLKVAFLGVFAHRRSRRKLLLSATRRRDSSAVSRRVVMIIPPLMESHDGHIEVPTLTSEAVETRTRFSESGRIAART
jgi:hypothetical protein